MSADCVPGYVAYLKVSETLNPAFEPSLSPQPCQLTFPPAQPTEANGSTGSLQPNVVSTV